VVRPRRRNSLRPRRGTPESLALALPDGLRRFRPSTDPNDFRLHLAAVSSLVGDRLALPVMNAAGLSAADWYRQAFERQDHSAVFRSTPTHPTTQPPNVDPGATQPQARRPLRLV
jgi:hypothetical protein